MAKNNPIQAYSGVFDAITRMYRHEGFISLYRGAMVNILAGSLANSVFFYIYADGKVRYNYDPAKPNSWTTILISLRASLVAMCISTPFWVVKTRLALYKDSHKGTERSRFVIWNVVKDMAVNEGPKAFFKGIGPSILLSTYGIIQMYCYENVNHALGYTSGQKMTKDNFLIPFVVGGLSKSLASFCMMPMNVVRLRLQMKQFSPE